MEPPGRRGAVEKLGKPSSAALFTHRPTKQQQRRPHSFAVVVGTVERGRRRWNIWNI